MQKSIAIVLGLSVIVGAFLLAGTAFAVKPNGPAAYNGLNKGMVNHLELYEKNAGDPDWEPTEDGAFGRLTWKDESFVFNGHMLEPGEEYTLVNYQDPWPTAQCMAEDDVADEYGDVHLSGDMPEELLYSTINGGKDNEYQGAKIWLVLSSDVNCDDEEMTGWTPTEYLFEYVPLPEE